MAYRDQNSFHNVIRHVFVFLALGHSDLKMLSFPHSVQKFNHLCISTFEMSGEFRFGFGARADSFFADYSADIRHQSALPAVENP
jgi:hypothetical protein